MASNIKFKRSAVQNRVPTTAQLELGELALNTYDGKLYTEKNSGSAAVVEIGSILSSLVVDGDNGGGNGDVTFHGATAGRDVTWDASADSLIALDNTKISLGTSSDLSLYHDSSHNYLKSTNGRIYLQGIGRVQLQTGDGSSWKNNLVAYQNDRTDIYHNNVIRVTTTADGADVSGTGSLKIPVGTTAQRSGSPTAGDLRYNSTTGGFEGYSASWGELGGGGVGIGSTTVNPGSGVVGHRVGVGFTDINFVGAGLSVTGYGTTIVVDIGNAVSRKYGRKIHSYTATANQTAFTGLSYTDGSSQVSVYLNGAKLSAATYTATSGSTVVLGTGASVGDEVEILVIDSGVDISRTVHSYTATAGQTAFTGLGYEQGGNLDVYLNGIRLAQSDYTANNGTSLTLATGASVGDLLEIVDMGPGAQWESGFGEDNDDIFRFNGGVGIGTTNPTDKLNIVGNVEILGILTATTFSGVDTDKIEEGNTSVETVDTGSDGHIKFITEGTEKARIRTDGNMGIGFNATNPQYQLMVQDAINTAYAANATNAVLSVGNVSSGAATNSAGIYMYSDGNGRGVVNLNCLNNSSNASADFSIQTRHGGTLAERFRIKSDGKVGIAQASPDYALDVTGDIGFTSQMRGASGSASAPAYSFDGDSDTGMFRGGVNTLSFATGGTARVTVTDATTTVANNLTVSGNFQVDGTTTTVNTATMTVEDKNIEIAKGAANDAAADGAGITVDSGDGDKTWNWVDATDAWTSSEHIHLGDSKKLLLGTHSDSELYFTGTNTILDHTSGSGTLFLRGDALRLQTTQSTPEDYIVCNSGGAVELYHNDIKKFETTSSGATVTGTLTATTLTGALSTTDACQTGDLTILNGNPDLRLKDSNHGGNNTEHMIAFQDSSGNNQMNIGSPFGEQHLRIKHGTTDLVKIQTDGNTGVGTASPQTKLHVQSGSLASGTIMCGGNYNAGGLSNNAAKAGAIHAPHYASDTYPKGFRAYGAYADNGVSMVQIGGGTNDARSATDIRFYTSSTATANGSEKLRIASDGKVGISETSPQALLHLNDGANSAIMFGNTTNGYKIRANVTGSNDYGLLIEDEDGVDLYRAVASTGSSNADTHTFFTGGSERFRITSTGQLQATGAADVRLTLGSSGTAGTNDSVHIRADSADLKFMAASGGNTMFEVNGTETLRITSGGSVRVGNNSSFSAHAAADDLVVGTTSGSNGMTILTGVATGSIFFNDGSGNEGVLQYIHTGTQHMRIKSEGYLKFDIGGGTDTLHITSGGVLCVGATAADGDEFLRVKNKLLVMNTANTGDAFIKIKAGEAGGSVLEFEADEGDDYADLWRVQNAGDGLLGFRTKASGSWVQKLSVHNDKVMFSVDAKVDSDNSKDLGASGARWRSLHLGTSARIGATGTTAATSGDDLVIEGSSDRGISIISGSGSSANIYFGDSGDADIGRIAYQHNDNALDFSVNAGSTGHRIHSTGNYFYGQDNVFFGATSGNANGELRIRSIGTAVYQHLRFTSSDGSSHSQIMGYGGGSILFHYSNEFVWAINNQGERLNLTNTSLKPRTSSTVLDLGTTGDRYRRTYTDGITVNTSNTNTNFCINGGSAANVMTIRNTTGGNGNVGILFSTQDHSGGREKAAIYHQETHGQAHYGGDFIFCLANSTGGAAQVATSDERFRMKRDGRFEMKASNTSTAYDQPLLKVQLHGQAQNDKTFLSLWNGNASGDLGSQTSHLDFVFQDGNTNVKPQARISATVGNGGDSNTVNLEGKGYLTFHCSNTAADDGDEDPGQRLKIAHDGTFTGSSSNNISDQRLKENIATITDATTKIKGLTGRTFTWRADADMQLGTKYGFIAQEVEPVVEELVCSWTGIRVLDKDGNVTKQHEPDLDKGDSYAKSVNVDGVVPILVEALKEAIAKIETLETKVAALESS